MTIRLSDNDPRRQAMFTQVERLAWLLDNSIHIPVINYRIGLDAIVGLIPGLGDFAGLLVSAFIVIQAMRIGVPGMTLLRMVLNIAAEALVGLVPLFGDVFDAAFKSNIRNVRLLTLAIDNQQLGRPLGGKAAGKGALVIIIGVLVGIVVLTGGAGLALFWAILLRLRDY
ncbi:hypothetical protein BH10CHL1_BH10CHL1_21360 [soil metagenome]